MIINSNNNRIYIVDAFSDIAFNGNPAAVLFLNDFLDDKTMQKIAYYYNLPDFVFIKQKSIDIFEVRFFTSMDESPVCIHGTLASSHIIFNKICKDINSITILSKNNKFIITKKDNSTNKITINLNRFNIYKSKKIIDFKGLIGLDCIADIYEEENSYIIILKNYKDIINAKPNFNEISLLDKRSFIITSPGFDKYDFCIRYFAPKVGIYEDYVCGSGNCKVFEYWSKYLNKNRLCSFQPSIRPGEINLEIINKESILISGESYLVSYMDLNLNLIN